MLNNPRETKVVKNLDYYNVNKIDITGLAQNCDVRISLPQT